MVLDAAASLKVFDLWYTYKKMFHRVLRSRCLSPRAKSFINREGNLIETVRKCLVAFCPKASMFIVLAALGHVVVVIK